jgi:hypothetical protein
MDPPVDGGTCRSRWVSLTAGGYGGYVGYAMFCKNAPSMPAVQYLDEVVLYIQCIYEAISPSHDKSRLISTSSRKLNMFVASSSVRSSVLDGGSMLLDWVGENSAAEGGIMLPDGVGCIDGSKSN